MFGVTMTSAHRDVPEPTQPPGGDMNDSKSLRKVVPGDLDQEGWSEQRYLLAQKLLALALNNNSGTLMEVDNYTREELIECAVENGIIVFDDLHHAPMCPANHWHKMRMPTRLCTCGAR